MPIDGVSDRHMIPRLGIIRLGIKVEGQGKNPYPKATDYFVCPPEVKAVFGDQPKELAIMFPTNDMEQVARQYLRCYGQTFGLVCWGDGKESKWKMDAHTGAMVGRDSKDWEWKAGVCNPESCHEYGARCRRVMNLMFMLPDVPGLGVWQINTSSFYSIVNVNSVLGPRGIIRELTKDSDHPDGRIAFIPLTLKLLPLDVTPRGISTKTVQILHVRTDVRLRDVLIQARQPPAQLLMPDPVSEEAPDDLYPPEVLELHEGQEEAAAPPAGDEDIFGLEKERQDAWTAIRELMPTVRVDEKTARSYFANVCDVSLSLETLAQEAVPPSLTIHHLREFRERLDKSRMSLG